MKFSKYLKHADTDPVAMLLIDLKGHDFEQDYPIEDRIFAVTTYSKLAHPKKKSKQVLTLDQWESLFKSLNDFLITLNDDEVRAFVEFYIEAKRAINMFNAENGIAKETMSIIEQLRFFATELFINHDISKKIVEYVSNSDIEIPEALKNAGTEDYHTKEKTFYIDDYYPLICVVFICKLFCPVFGEFIACSRQIVDNLMKEIYCIGILKDIFERDFKYITNKLAKAIRLNVNTWIDPANLKSSCSGFTQEWYGIFLYASVLVKKFVNVDIRGKSSNIAVYLYTSASDTVTNLSNQLGNKRCVTPFINPSEEGPDGGNDSNMEISSSRSSKPADIIALSEFGAECAIEEHLSVYDVDPNVFLDFAEYYENLPSPITLMNRYVISTVFGHSVGGAAGISMINVKTFFKLVALCQTYMLSLGYDEIAHLLSVIPTTNIKESYTADDIRIESTLQASYAYRNCKKLYPYDLGKTSWDTSVVKICKKIITTSHKYNSPPLMFDMLKEDNRNGQVFQYNTNIIHKLNQFIFGVVAPK